MRVSNGNLRKQFEITKNANVPLMALNTPDPASTLAMIKAAYPNNPVVQWDVLNGATAVTSAATDSVNNMNRLLDGSINPAMATGNPAEMLMKIKALPPNTILCMFNAHMFTDKMQPGNLAAPVIQAVWNVRDEFKKKKSTLVLMAHNYPIPDELQHDLVVLDEQLPTGTELESIIVKSCVSAGLRTPGKKTMPGLVEATKGLAPFSIDQIIRMSARRSRQGKMSIDIDQLWDRKIAKIESAVGLKIHRTGPKFDEIGGNENIKDYLRKVARSVNRPTLVVFMDEIEKSMAAAGTDTSGVTTDQLKVLLTEMQNNFWRGMIGYGFPGTGKSLLAKAFGHECGALTVEADLGAMKHIWVGSSEARMRQFMKVIKAMGGNKVFFFATCNHVEILRPELQRRFIDGIWFFDLPVRTEKEMTWAIHLKKNNLPNHDLPDDTGWTGSEIDVCCRKAAEFGISLKDSCRYMTVVSQAMGENLEKMRKAASGKYVSAHTHGPYNYNPNPEPAPERKGGMFGRK
jgi:ATPase family associated with various cellular activities (AAA)